MGKLLLIALNIHYLSVGMIRAEYINEIQIDEPRQCKIQFYETWAGYNHPIKLIGPISKEKALSRRAAYYVAYYDCNKKLVKVEKHRNGSIDYSYKYEYYENKKLKSAKLSNSEGDVKVLKFDINGNQIN